MAIAGAVTRDDRSRLGRITVAAHETERLVPENLNLALAGGRAVFERSRVEVAPGERVQIVVEQWFGQERSVSRDGGCVAAGRRTTTASYHDVHARRWSMAHRRLAALAVAAHYG